jgi:hypothetical protein
MRAMNRFGLIVSLPLIASLALAGEPVVRAFGNEKAITPERLKAHLEFIASDELEGRDTPSRGLDIATLYVAAQLKLWGAQPAGENGTFFQQMRMARQSLDRANSAIQFGGQTYEYGDGIKGANSPGQATGGLVYVGHGYMIKSRNINPYAGVNVKGKILVVAMGVPKGATFSDIRVPEGEDFLTPDGAAKKFGAVGVISIPNARFNSRWRADAEATGFEPQKEDKPVPAGGLPSVIVGPSLAEAIFKGEKISATEVAKGTDAPQVGLELAPAKTLTINVLNRNEVAYARNVVAIVPGSDAKLKNEYVAYGAHIDHIGVNPTGSGDRINNGADDDGSGTVSILEIAHAYLTGPRPKRSSLFVWHIGEEKGLWGSDYYTTYPTVDMKSIVAQLNIDMIGRSRPVGDTNPANNVLTGPDEIYVVGSTKMSTDLQKLSERVNAGFLNIKFNYKYDDPKDTENIFYRSDHFNYARKGVPIIFYFDGVHQDYHQVSDEVSKIDFRKMSRVARTVYATGWELANGKGRPVVDKPLKD